MSSSLTVTNSIGQSTSGKVYTQGTSIESIVKDMLSGPPIEPYTGKIWYTQADVDGFLYCFNHDNGYSYNGTTLQVGDTITIRDGTYNTQWLIAGFDCEKSRTASDNTTYDNGYGIALVPKNSVGNNSKWNNDSTLVGAYESSIIHNNTLPNITAKLRSILGTHLINRNVLLSNSANGTSPRSNVSDGYIWTTAHLTLMSGTQLGANIASYTNKYDDGEANYKLDLFSDNASRITTYDYWTRGIRGSGGGNAVWYVRIDGSFGYISVSNTESVRPLIYIR